MAMKPPVTALCIIMHPPLKVLTSMQPTHPLHAPDMIQVPMGDQDTLYPCLQIRKGMMQELNVVWSIGFPCVYKNTPADMKHCISSTHTCIVNC